MADIKVFSRLLTGIHRDIDTQQNSLVVGSLKVGAISPSELTKAILDNLIALQNGSDFANGTNAHTHDGRYFTETEIGSASGTSGAQLVGVKTSAVNHTPASQNVESYLASIDSALASAGGTSFSDAVFEITDNLNATKKLVFQVAAISGSTTRTITMPDADVDFGALTNSNISASAAIALSKLAAVTANRALVSDASGYATAATTTDVEIGYVSGVTSSIQSQLGGKLALAGGTMSGNIAMGNNKVTGLLAGSSNNDAVNKAQLDAAIGGLSWKLPISDPDLVNPNLAVQPISPANGDVYIASATAGDWTAGHAYFSLDEGVTWIDLLNRAVAIGDRFGVSMESPTTAVGALSGKDDQIATVTVATPGSVDFSFEVPADKDAIYVNADLSSHFGHQYTYRSDLSAWLEFGGTSALVAGIGLVINANTLSVNMGAGIAQLPSDEVGIDVHVDGGLMTTIDNSSSSTDTTAQLAIKLDGSTLSKGASGLKVAALGITDSEISASAAIAYSKLSLSASIVDGDINGSAAIAYSKLNLSSSIVNADVASGAAIAYSKLSLSASIVDADISSSAAIAYSKLALSNSVTASDITTGVADQSTITGGNGTALSVSSSPSLKGSEVAGESFAASLFAVRFAKAADAGFVAGRMYKADIDASVVDNFYVVGLVNQSASAGGAISVTKMGPMTVTSHGFTVGAPLFLDASGAVTSTAPSAANMAVVRVGFAKTANVIEVQIQVIGVA